MEIVAASAVRDWIKKGEPLVLMDSSTPDVWLHDHAGANRLSPEEVSPSRPLLGRGKVIVYSSSANGIPASLYAKTLLQQGHPIAAVLDGGPDAWRSLGLADGANTRYPSRW